MSHKNNHELTTVAVREELDRALGSSVSAQKKEEVFATVERIAQRYSSPYPDQNFLTTIEKLAPGSAQQIIDATIKDLEHRRVIDMRELEVKEKEMDTVTSIATMDFRSVGQGRYMGFAAFIVCFIFSGTMAYLGQNYLALAGFGTAALGIITQLIRGSGSSAVQFVRGKPNAKQETTVAKSPKPAPESRK